MAILTLFLAARSQAQLRRLFSLFLLCPLLTGCLARDISAPAPSSMPIQNGISTLVPTATITFTIAPTIAPTATLVPLPAPTETISPQLPTPTPTLETRLPTPTVDPDLLTSGQEAWRLIALEKRHAVEDMGFLLTPRQFNHSPLNYQFLTFDFECTTGTPLLEIVGGNYANMTYASKTSGFEGVFVTDRLGRHFPVTIISACWLAAPVPKDSSGYTLYINDLPPFVPSIVARTIHRTATPEFDYCCTP